MVLSAVMSYSVFSVLLGKEPVASEDTGGDCTELSAINAPSGDTRPNKVKTHWQVSWLMALDTYRLPSAFHVIYDAPVAKGYASTNHSCGHSSGFAFI